MAVTLMQAAIDNDLDNREGTLVEMFSQVSPIFPWMPMVEIEGRWYDYERETTLPGAGWRAVGGSYTESTGVTTPYREHLKIIGGDADSDLFIERTAKRAALSSLKKQLRMKMQASSNEWDRCFFEGSELVNPNEMVGLRSRVSGSQLILMASGGGTLTLAKLDEAIDAVPFAHRPDSRKMGEGESKVIFMNRTMRRKLTALVDAASGARRIEEKRDAFGRQNEYYANLPIMIVETTGDGTSVLGFDEDPGDGTSDTCSIYVVAFGEDLVHGIYNNGGNGRLLIVDTFEQLQTAPKKRVRVEGYYGQAIEHPRSASRLYGITNT